MKNGMVLISILKRSCLFAVLAVSGIETASAMQCRYLEEVDHPIARVQAYVGFYVKNGLGGPRIIKNEASCKAPDAPVRCEGTLFCTDKTNFGEEYSYISDSVCNSIMVNGKRICPTAQDCALDSSVSYSQNWKVAPARNGEGGGNQGGFRAGESSREAK